MDEATDDAASLATAVAVTLSEIERVGTRIAAECFENAAAAVGAAAAVDEATDAAARAAAAAVTLSEIERVGTRIAAECFENAAAGAAGAAGALFSGVEPAVLLRHPVLAC